MNTTPQSNRLTVSIFGRCNAGKSALFNAFTDTDNAIVSEIPGTTTDPVTKSMELFPHGPIVLIDTAGLGDGSSLGDARVKKTQAVLNRTDLVLYAMDPLDPGLEDFRRFRAELERREIPYLTLLTKTDAAPADATDALCKELPEAVPVSSRSPEDMEQLKSKVSAQLDALNQEEHLLLGGLLPAGSVVVLVVPVDSEAPKGRLILPQVQLIRECLDCGMRCHVTTEKELPRALGELEQVDLVVTDSQAFALAARLVPERIPLTSFSILMARQKSDLFILEEGARSIANLGENDRVLIAETCTHNRSHEDIGRVKIPKLLQALTGKHLRFDFAAGRDYPDSLEDYAVIIHCGGCMITRKEMLSRIRIAGERHIPITNYGMVLALCNGILDRSMAVIHQNAGGHFV